MTLKQDPIETARLRRMSGSPARPWVCAHNIHMRTDALPSFISPLVRNPPDQRRCSNSKKRFEPSASLISGRLSRWPRLPGAPSLQGATAEQGNSRPATRTLCQSCGQTAARRPCHRPRPTRCSRSGRQREPGRPGGARRRPAAPPRNQWRASRHRRRLQGRHR